MAFSIDNPADLLALKTEVNTDPTGMSYSLESTSDTLDKLNNPAMNVGGESINKAIEDLDIPDVSAVIVGTEYAALSEYNKEWVKSFINKAIEEPMLPYRDKFVAVFTGTATLTAVSALRPKLATRAEILFGVNTIISKNNWMTARDS